MQSNSQKCENLADTGGLLSENLNLFATDPQLCYLLSRYDDCCFFSPTVFSLFLSCLPLFPESPLPTFCSFSISCDFHAYPHCERALLCLFSWHPNVFGTLLNITINFAMDLSEE